MKRLFLVLLLAALATAGFSTPQHEVLHIYTAFDTEEAQYYIEAFEAETGIKVEWVRMSLTGSEVWNENGVPLQNSAVSVRSGAEERVSTSGSPA